MAWGAGDLVGMEQASLAARGAVRWETGTEPQFTCTKPPGHGACWPCLGFPSSSLEGSREMTSQAGPLPSATTAVGTVSPSGELTEPRVSVSPVQSSSGSNSLVTLAARIPGRGLGRAALPKLISAQDPECEGRAVPGRGARASAQLFLGPLASRCLQQGSSHGRRPPATSWAAPSRLCVEPCPPPPSVLLCAGPGAHGPLSPAGLTGALVGAGEQLRSQSQGFQPHRPPGV